MPKVGRGLFPLKGSVQWYIAYWRNRALGREANTAKSKREEIQTKILEAEYQEQTGHLIARAEVIMVMSANYARLNKSLQRLCSNLAREFSLSPEISRAMRDRVDQMQKQFVRDSKEFLDVTDDEAGDASSSDNSAAA